MLAYTQKWAVILPLIFTLFSTAGLAVENGTNNRGGDGTQGFEFPIVRSDADIKKMGLSREQYNKQNPAAESQWRRAWAAQGTKNDMSTFQFIRKNTAAPTRGQ